MRVHLIQPSEVPTNPSAEGAVVTVCMCGCEETLEHFLERQKRDGKGLAGLF